MLHGAVHLRVPHIQARGPGGRVAACWVGCSTCVWASLAGRWVVLCCLGVGRVHVEEGGQSSLSGVDGWMGGQGKRWTEAMRLCPSNVSPGEWLRRGWLSGRPERGWLGSPCSEVVWSRPGKVAAETGKGRSQVAPERLEDCGLKWVVREGTGSQGPVWARGRASCGALSLCRVSSQALTEPLLCDAWCGSSCFHRARCGAPILVHRFSSGSSDTDVSRCRLSLTLVMASETQTQVEC